MKEILELCVVIGNRFRQGVVPSRCLARLLREELKGQRSDLTCYNTRIVGVEELCLLNSEPAALKVLKADVEDGTYPSGEGRLVRRCWSGMLRS